MHLLRTMPHHVIVPKPGSRFGLALLLSIVSFFAMAQSPLRVGVAGLTHSHVHGILGRPLRGDILVVGIAEPNRELATRYLKQYNLPDSLWFPSVQAMLDKTRPEAVAAFGSIFEHLAVVEACAPRGIHVMVEKPLAVTMEHARRMETLARQHKIELLTNYETTWYPSHDRIHDFVNDNRLGPLRKIVVHDGHPGPKEIGVEKEFLAWLTDPKQNGGGAVVDFGCYGANLITWLMQGKRPVAVTAVLQTFKPGVYAQVDDEASFIIEYESAQGIVQASWNWPFGRKDMEVYGASGYAIADDRDTMRRRLAGEGEVTTETLVDRAEPRDDPFSYFRAVIRKELTPERFDLSSLENNLLVVEILDAARKSARTGRRVVMR